MKPWIAPSLAVVAGVVVSIAVSRTSTGDKAGERPGPSEARIVPVADPHAAMDKRRIARPEERVPQLATERTENGEAPSPPPSGDRSPASHREDLPSEEDALAMHRTSHDALVASVRAQGTDPSWSAGAAAKFTG